jgi:tRNA(fMet)-specific endonuclease VapC
MPGNELLFDTNAFIAWWNEDAALARQVVGIGEPSLSLITLAELLLGAKKSGRPQENLEALNRRIPDFRLLIPDRGTADLWADVSLALRRKGRPIPTNDIWIAALALQHGLPLLTRDAHFREVEGLNVLGW